MRADLTWLTTEKHRQNLPNYQACAIVGMSKSPLDFNADPGTPNPSTSGATIEVFLLVGRVIGE